ncbi:hypothetical protein ABZ297_19200 [Nonomuraea sp. NPDC005983]|uniref:hypothetical protein n=1 Tax=Nonomuraea sp. NPDC005983 TaxID=3155595 RepID=UPI0033B91C57
MVVGGGIAFGTAGVAAATTSHAAPMIAEPNPYPPTPNIQEQETNANTEPRVTNTQDQTIDVDVTVRGRPGGPNGVVGPGGPGGPGGPCGANCGPGGGPGGGSQLPFTGAPVSTLVAAGAGLLLVGTASTLIAVRRRRSTSAQ